MAPSRQATLLSLGKVVTSRTSSYYNVSVEDILKHKKTLEDRDASRETFVGALRQLSSMMMRRTLLEQSMVGQTVNRVAKKHPDAEVREQARAIVAKWKGEVLAQTRRDERKSRRVEGWAKAGGPARR